MAILGCLCVLGTLTEMVQKSPVHEFLALKKNSYAVNRAPGRSSSSGHDTHVVEDGEKEEESGVDNKGFLEQENAVKNGSVLGPAEHHYRGT